MAPRSHESITQTDPFLVGKYIPQRWNPTDVVECVPQASKMPFELHGLAAAHSALSNCTRIQFKAGIPWYSTGNACCDKHAVAS